MSKYNSSIEIKIDKSTLPQDGQKVKFFVDDEWFEGEFDDNEEMFSVKADQFWFAWQVHEWQPVDDTPRREHLPLSREQAEKIASEAWDEGGNSAYRSVQPQGPCDFDEEQYKRDKEEYLKQFS